MKIRHVPGVIAALCAAAIASTVPARGASPVPDKKLEAALRAVLRHEAKTDLTDEMLLNVYVLRKSSAARSMLNTFACFI